MKITLLFLFVVILISGCALQNNDPPTNWGDQDIFVGIEGVEEKIELSNYEFETFDDSTVLHFPREKVGDVYVEKTIKYDVDGSGEIELELEGNGEYISIIPKSFAEHVDDIDFSVKPDEIINDDPIVKWMIKTIEGKTKKIVMKVKKAAYKKGKEAGVSQGVSHGLAEIGNFLSGGDVDFAKVEKKAKEEGMKAGMNAGLDVMLDHLEDFLFISDISICANKKTHKEQHDCLMLSISKHPKWYNCKEIFSESILNEVACESIKQDKPTMCDDLNNKLGDLQYEEIVIYDYIGLCQQHYFEIKALACEGLYADTKELCIINLVNKTGYKEGCNELFIDSKKRCFEAINGNKSKGDEDLPGWSPEGKDMYPNGETGDKKTIVPIPMPVDENDKKDKTNIEKVTSSLLDENEEDCSLKTTVSQIDSCYQSRAIDTGQVSFCDMGSTLKYIENCYSRVASKHKVCEVCEMISKENYLRFECLLQCAASTGDTGVCDKMDKSEHTIESCKVSVAERTEDVSICDHELNIQFNKDDCYKKVASRKKDSSICNKIVNQNEKDNCIRWLKE